MLVQKLDAVKLNFVQTDTFALVRIVFLVVHQTMTVQTQENVRLEFVMKSFVRKIQIALNHLDVIQVYVSHMLTVMLTLIVLQKWFAEAILAYMDRNAKASLIVNCP